MPISRLKGTRTTVAKADSTGRRNTLIVEVLMGRPAGWMRELTGRSAMKSPGGIIAVFDTNTGHTLAIVEDEHYFSDIRTAASEQSRPRCSPRIRSGSPPCSAAEFRRTGKLKHFIESVDEAVRESDVLITTAQSREPIVKAEWLHSGQHITAIGSDDAMKAEIDAASYRRADRVIVDSVKEARARGKYLAGYVVASLKWSMYMARSAKYLPELRQGANPSTTSRSPNLSALACRMSSPPKLRFRPSTGSEWLQA